jgi:S1-C subfamily serine protease
VRCFSLCVLVFQAPMFGTTDWTALADRLDQSVMQISDWCSAFAIDNERDYVLTAKHCASDDPQKPTIVDLIPSRVVAEDVQRDLLVLHVPGLDRKALPLAKDDPAIGAEVASYGYGMGLVKPMFRIAHVANTRVTLPSLDGEWVIFDGAFVGGQSGAPVVNAAGEVVALVQMTTDRVGIGRGAKMIGERVGKYFAKPKQP